MSNTARESFMNSRKKKTECVLQFMRNMVMKPKWTLKQTRSSVHCRLCVVRKLHRFLLSQLALIILHRRTYYTQSSMEIQ